MELSLIGRPPSERNIIMLALLPPVVSKMPYQPTREAFVLIRSASTALQEIHHEIAEHDGGLFAFAGIAELFEYEAALEESGLFR